MHQYFNPGRFLRFINRVAPWLGIVTCFSLAAGLYMALVTSPADYQQGEMVRIMYIHVPSAWMALFIYSFMAACSAASLIWKNPLSDMLAQSAAPIGTAFAAITLVTGSLWGKPVWGTWWVWDARLTSMLILFFFYIGYMALLAAFDDKTRAARAAALLSLVGAINIPIVKFSVDFWSTLHQPASIFRKSGPAIHASMLTPLLLMILGVTTYFLLLLCIRTKTAVLKRKTDRLEAYF